MTRRERQLLEWIRENPCISQQELADKAGITRSSAAVHISNLMRKGYIAGRGYLLREAPYIAVVGGVNMDIGAVSDAPLVARDSNPGRVTTSLGGVGRNIAHNLCLLGEQVSMITVLGQDGFAQSVRENAADIGLDLSHSATIPGGRTGTYLFIDGCDGDMALAVNDMAIYGSTSRRSSCGSGWIISTMPIWWWWRRTCRRRLSSGCAATAPRLSWPTRSAPSRRRSCCRCWIS